MNRFVIRLYPLVVLFVFVFSVLAAANPGNRENESSAPIDQPSGQVGTSIAPGHSANSANPSDPENPTLQSLGDSQGNGQSGSGGSGSLDVPTVGWGHKPEPLPTVGSYENLKILLADAQQNSGSYGMAGESIIIRRNSMAADTGLGAAMKSAAPAQAPDTAAPAPVTGAAVPQASAPADYSQTNVQVAGVDEADVVKTDGRYIYQVNADRVIIAQAYPASEMKIVNTLKFKEENLYPREIYVDSRHLVVIGDSRIEYPNQPAPMAPQIQANGLRTDIYPPIFAKTSVKIVVFDISDKSSVKKVRDAEIEGSYISSRKVGSALYLVANQQMDYYRIMEGQEEPPTPSYRDSAASDVPVQIGYPDIRYFPGCVEPGYLLVGGLNLDKPDQEMQVDAYLGSGQNVYSSEKNLYVAITKYAPPVAESKTGSTGTQIGGIFSSGTTAGVSSSAAAGASPSVPVSSKSPVAPAILPPNPVPPAPPANLTEIYRFGLDSGKAEYTGKGQVPGTILNQFSMDEAKGYFRIATTTGEIWRNDDYTSKNNIFVMDKDLAVTGKVEDIAPGEKIYSVRFMGDRAYMVTFKTVDPLFVIDLKDPKAPKILGALKIPGYSDYLHPYDANHIIGFGKDTIELSQKDPLGQGSTMAYYQGMKIALFDVTDVSHPIEMFKETIGDRGTDSELLHNHKALLFSPEKDLLAFPVTVMEIPNNTSVVGGMPQYGQFAYQGAYVYNISLSNGFQLKGRITHLSDDAMLKAGQGWYDSALSINRILNISNNLYTLSAGMIKANDLNSLQELNKLTIPQN